MDRMEGAGILNIVLFKIPQGRFGTNTIFTPYARVYRFRFRKVNWGPLYHGDDMIEVNEFKFHKADLGR